MIIGSISCPWGKKKVDLSKKQLTVLEKTWFVQEMIMEIMGRKNVRELAEMYNGPSVLSIQWKLFVMSFNKAVKCVFIQMCLLT